MTLSCFSTVDDLKEHHEGMAGKKEVAGAQLDAVGESLPCSKSN